METVYGALNFLSMVIASFLLFLPFSTPSFTPKDSYLISCGSNRNVSADNRLFVADSVQPGSQYLSGGQSFMVKNANPSPNSPALYHAARVFTARTSYSFGITQVASSYHFVRFHFSPFKDEKFNLSDASFCVSVGGHMVLNEFNTSVDVLKEFILMVNGEELEISFIPSALKFGFVNAIEVFSAPADFFIDDGAKLIGQNGNQAYNLSSKILKTVHRINVGGLKLTPFNDTLWRNWVNDEPYLVLQRAAKRASTVHVPNYEKGGASREIAPDNVYMTAQQMNRDNMTSGAVFNITWEFPVGSGSIDHLVRLHFCDIVSLSLNQLYFDVFINEFLAYRDLDLSTLTFHLLASPYYLDFVVDSDRSGVISISLGPSSLSTSLKINAILNGVEIFKMVNLELPNAKSQKKNIWILLSYIGGGIIILFLTTVAILIVFRCLWRKPKPRRSESNGWTPLHAHGSLSYYSRTSRGTALASPGPNGYAGLRMPFSDIQLATNNFDKNLIIGSGGFGMVYRGTLKDNSKVAVKRGVPGSRQGLPEFQSELKALSRIRHRHLVSLIGYCEELCEMILVYEYMELGPLRNHLYDSTFEPLSWKQRLEICIGSARGLHYLHTGSAQGIIHRDVKSTNILLDDNYVPKVADFGLSRLGPSLNETHVSTGVKGSFGYLDPEYFRRQQLTDKSDVYSFGVVLLEVLCARPAVDPLLAREQVNLAEWAMQWQKKGHLEKIIDPHLVGKIKPKSLKKFSDTAEKCLADYGIDRPTMGDVLWNLEYALQLQESGERSDPQEDGHQSTSDPQTSGIVTGDPSSSTVDENDDNTSVEISTTKVFSQLMKREGR